MEILFLDSVESTHTYLKKHIKENGYHKPLAIATTNQTNGLGSRENSWDGKKGNLFFSFVLDKSLLPEDVPLQSYSIYFSYILKLLLSDLGSKVYLKWPNDFYLVDKKIGGTITSITSELIYCGIGLNLQYVKSDYGFLDIQVEPKKILKQYFCEIDKSYSWKHIFSKYLIEFEYNKKFKTTIDNKKVSLKNATLNVDGSITIDNKKVFSLR